MKISFYSVFLLAMCAGMLVPDTAYCQAVKKKARIAVQAVVEDAKPADDKAAKPDAKKDQPVGVEALAAPFVEALEAKMDLNAVDAQVQQWMPQFLEQYRPILVTELNFIRHNCELTAEQRPKIKKAGEAALKDAVRKTAEQQARQNQGVQVNGQLDPRKIIREGLTKALKDVLPADKMAKYAAEAEKRAALRKRVAIISVIARMDSIMCLTPEQRDKITESLNSQWQDRWEQWLFLSIYGDQYLPIVPDNCVVAHLNDEQKVVWNGVQKVDFGFWAGNGQAEENDGWWGDEPAKPARPMGGIGFF